MYIWGFTIGLHFLLLQLVRERRRWLRSTRGKGGASLGEVELLVNSLSLGSSTTLEGMELIGEGYTSCTSQF